MPDKAKVSGIPPPAGNPTYGLIYFYFSKEHKGALGLTAGLGIWFIMISFGASFGYTVMARVSLLIGRAQFLLINWLHLIK